MINKLKSCLDPKYKMLDIVPTIVSYREKSFDVLEGKFKFINKERHRTTPPLNFPGDPVKK